MGHSRRPASTRPFAIASHRAATSSNSASRHHPWTSHERSYGLFGRVATRTWRACSERQAVHRRAAPIVGHPMPRHDWPSGRICRQRNLAPGRRRSPSAFALMMSTCPHFWQAASSTRPVARGQQNIVGGIEVAHDAAEEIGLRRQYSSAWLTTSQNLLRRTFNKNGGRNGRMIRLCWDCRAVEIQRPASSFGFDSQLRKI